MRIASLLVPLALGAAMLRPVFAEEEASDLDAWLHEELPEEKPGAAAGAADDTIPVERAEEPEEIPPARSSSRLVEEILVTAQRREELTQDVPISIHAFSEAALDARGISDAINLPLVVPGMVYSSIANYSIIFIRGVGTDAFVPSADPSIATYFDGVYFPFAHGQVQSFGAIERVEVLKGPQGTLFGRNSTGGAISVHSKKPGFQPEGSVQVSYGRFSDFRSRAYLNVPLSDTLAFNVSALYSLADQYYKLTEDSPRRERNPLPDENERGARIRLLWAPADRFDLILSGLLVEQSGMASNINQNTSPNPQYRLVGVQETDPYRSSIDADAYSRSRNPVVFGEANYRASWFDTRLLASHQAIRTSAAIDYDATRAPLVSFDADQFADVTTYEAQFLSNDTSPGASWLEWVAGVFHLESLAGFAQVDLMVGRDFAFFDNVLGALQNGLDPLLGLTELTEALGGSLDGLGTGVIIQGEGQLRTRATAGFFQGTVHLPWNLRLTLGGRYQTETRKLQGSRDRLQLTDTVAIPLFDFADQSADTSNFSPRVALDWNVADDVMLYASFSRGFKSGTFNVLNIYTPTQFIDPETVTSYEVGLKSRLFNRRLQFNGAVFQTDMDNMQVQFISLLSGGAVRFETAEAARIRGAEIDVIWEIAPSLLPGLVSTLNAAYLDARYTDYPRASGFTEGGIPFGGTGLIIGGGVLPGRDFSGNRIVRSPEWSGTAGLSYTFDGFSGTFEVAGDVYYNSGYYYTAQNLASAEEEAYSTVDARASYLHHRSNVRLTLFGRNLTDTLHAINRLPTDIGTWSQFASPRTWGLRLNWDF